MEISKSMYIIKSSWGPQGEEKPTFKMIPLSLDCPYQECIFDPTAKILAVISKVQKQTYNMVVKVDDLGDPVFLRNGAKRPNGKNYKEERRVMESYQEYYIEDPSEIAQFVYMFGFNYDSYKELVNNHIYKSSGTGNGTTSNPTSPAFTVVGKEAAAEKNESSTGGPVEVPPGSITLADPEQLLK